MLRLFCSAHGDETNLLNEGNVPLELTYLYLILDQFFRARLDKFSCRTSLGYYFHCADIVIPTSAMIISSQCPCFLHYPGVRRTLAFTFRSSHLVSAHGTMLLRDALSCFYVTWSLSIIYIDSEREGWGGSGQNIQSIQIPKQMYMQKSPRGV